MKKAQISLAMQQISAFVLATQIVQSVSFLNLKFQASSHLLWLYRHVFVKPSQKPQRQVFSQQGSDIGQLFQSIQVQNFSRDVGSNQIQCLRQLSALHLPQILKCCTIWLGLIFSLRETTQINMLSFLIKVTGLLR